MNLYHGFVVTGKERFIPFGHVMLLTSLSCHWWGVRVVVVVGGWGGREGGRVQNPCYR